MKLFGLSCVYAAVTPKLSKYVDSGKSWQSFLTGEGMYNCPHCHNRSISGAVLLSPPFTGQTTCPACGAALKIRPTVFSFLLPIYLVGRATLGMLFDLRFDLGFFGEMAVLAILAFLQLRLIVYQKVPPGHQQAT